MSDELEIIEEEAEPDNIHQAFFDRLSTEEQRRYICLDMARLFGSLPEKAVDHAKRYETYMLGKGLKAVE